MPDSPMTIDDALEFIRAQPRSQRDRGTSFERLVQRALMTHPGEYGATRFERIVLWSEWEGADGRVDTGIDLIGYQHNGKLAAIQCKCYSAGHTVKKGDIDGFIAASNRPEFDSRILVNTGDKFSPHATRLMSEVVPHVELVLLEDMRQWPIDDWSACFDDERELHWQHEPYTPMAHQQAAVDDVMAGFGTHDRGKMIMPCGTGKSVTALWIAEAQAGKGGSVLYLVPSIALMGQTMREWATNRAMPHRYLGVCSDSKTGKTDEDQTLAELTIPVTTDPERIGGEMRRSPDAMSVVFSTYQSLPKVAEAQRASGSEFDLVVCDEAHRTAGVDKGADSVFHLVHDAACVRASKRLYMTATPKVFTKKVAGAAADMDFGVYSMDDEAVFGPELHRLTFGAAIEDGLLSDYEVVVIAADSTILGDAAAEFADTGITHDDAVKLAGIIDALADPETTGATHASRATGTVSPLAAARRSIAFSTTIAKSKNVEKYLPRVADRLFSASASETRAKELVDLQVRHIDGKSDALTRARDIQWLREGDTGNTGCLMLTNARCLTEGVDVPALDAVVMCSPRKSQIDVVQAVGRVMRRSEGKATGYVILPVVVPDGLSAVDVLDKSPFAEVWSVLRALRSHDEQLDVIVNSADLGDPTKVPVRVLDITDAAASEFDRRVAESGDSPEYVAEQLSLEWRHAVASMVVEKVGDKQYWKKWGKRVAALTGGIETKIAAAARTDELSAAWASFGTDMKEAAGDQVADSHLAQMLAQHIVTMPVFDHLFEGADFTARNPIAIALREVTDRFTAAGAVSDDDLAELHGFYKSVADRLDGAQSSESRLGVLLEVYESFFKEAMPEAVSRLGIAYTPVEIVDFMLRSADAVLRDRLGKGLTDRDVHVLDPFTGTGTYIHRLLTGRRTCGDWLIEDADLDRKFLGGRGDDEPPELHANEIVLLAYYLAAIKIEEGRAERTPDAGYQSFQGIVFGDTFLKTATDSYLPGMRRNSRRAERQNDQRITAIIGNPPWSAGQKDKADDNPNTKYPALAERVSSTYGAQLKAVTGSSGGAKAFGNLYIKAWRWASDRLIGNPNGGLVCFVHPNSLATGPSLAGVRATLAAEFTDIWVIDLRGDANKAGEEFAKEGDKLFGAGSKNGVQITLAFRDPNEPLDTPARTHVARVDEYQDIEAKLDWLTSMSDVIHGADQFEQIERNDSHDWLDITDGSFERLPIPLISQRKSDTQAAASDHARGVTTACDPYVYAFTRSDLIVKVQRLIDEHNDTLDLWDEFGASETDLDELTKSDRPEAIKWTDRLRQTLKSRRRLEFDESRIRRCLYRPFVTKWLYEDPLILSSVNTISKMFPRDDAPSSSRSGSSRDGICPTCASPAGRPELSPGAADIGHVEHDVSGAGDALDAGLGGDQGVAADSGAPPPAIAPSAPPQLHALQPDQPSRLRLPRQPSHTRPVRSWNEPADPSPAEAILLTSPAGMAVTSMLAASTMADLHALASGQSARAVPRRS